MSIGLQTKVSAKVLTYFAINLQSAHKMWGGIITKLNERKSYGTHQQGGDPRERRSGPP